MRVSCRTLHGSSAIELPRRRSRFSVTSLSSTRATTIWPFSAVSPRRMIDRVAVQDAGLDHRIAGDLQRVVLAVAEQLRRHLDVAGRIAQRLDRQAGGDAAIQRQLDRRRVVGRADAGDASA